MKTNTDPNGNKNNITFRKYEKYGNTYIRARQWVTLIDGTVERLEGSGKNRVDARAALEKNIYERYGSLQKRTLPMPGMISVRQRKNMSRNMHIIVHLL